MDFSNIVFKRKFALTMYKDKKLCLGKMSFAKDFVLDRRGDPYLLLEKSDSALETVENNVYRVQNGAAKRILCQFFPFASYEVTACIAAGTVGFGFSLPCAEAEIVFSKDAVFFRDSDNSESVKLPDDLPDTVTFIVSCRPGAFDVFMKKNGRAQFFHTFLSPLFNTSNQFENFTDGYAALCVSGDVTVFHAESYIDCGISQADIRPIRYENGDIMVDHGKIYLTMSIRMQAEMFQGVFSWIPGTAEFDLTGVLFFDTGDGKWCGDVASSILYHREQKQFLLWVCSFNHGHILGYAAFDGDPRFGVNAIDITLMEKAPDDTARTEFLGFQGDEDPDFFFDTETKTWYMAVCRLDPAIRAYRYMFFKSDSPFEGYTYIGHGLDGAETGGSFVKIKNERYFVCGNDFNLTSNYRIYSKDGMQNAVFDHPDGGFRGWGTLMPIKIGSRTRYFWLTFDRHNGSDYNWSYGNLYCFEANL